MQITLTAHVSWLQIISFIDSSSGVNTAAGANRNIYYVNAFSNSLRSSTGVFLTNTDRQVSRLVEALLVYRPGTINLAAGINDLAARFSGLTVGYPAVAIVVAAGSSSRSGAVSAANRLRASYGGAVSVGGVALGSGTNRGTLGAISDSGLDGTSLSFSTPSFSSIAARCASVLANAGAAPASKPVTNVTSLSEKDFGPDQDRAQRSITRTITI